MPIQSKNPYTLEVNFETVTFSEKEISDKIEYSHAAFKIWKQKSIAERAKIIQHLAVLMAEDTENLAKLDAIEMGMPVKEAL